VAPGAPLSRSQDQRSWSGAADPSRAGPGLLLITAGLILLATEYAWAQRWLACIRECARRAARRMASERVASAIRHTDAPVELTVDAGDDMVRIEVRDNDASLPGSGRVISFELREASTDV
jgi:hypothetical protein